MKKPADDWNLNHTKSDEIEFENLRIIRTKKGVVSKVVSVIADLFRDLDSVVLKAILAQGRNDVLAYFDF
ncbi:MAG: hypothetical protein DYG99_15075 [Bacteroidetes bacterium CHB5]|nr:hypothetical protein [Bacteroidetes bacterium CHB5]